MRLELSGGQHAELRDRLTYGQGHIVRVAYYEIEQSNIAKADLDLALVRAYVSGWHVLDLDGKAVPLDTPELAPDDVIQEIALAASDLFAGTAIPKAGGEASPTTPLEQPSNGAIPGLAPSSSLTSIPAGDGMT